MFPPLLLAEINFILRIRFVIAFARGESGTTYAHARLSRMIRRDRNRCKILGACSESNFTSIFVFAKLHSLDSHRFPSFLESFDFGRRSYHLKLVYPSLDASVGEIAFPASIDVSRVSFFFSRWLS